MCRCSAPNPAVSLVVCLPLGGLISFGFGSLLWCFSVWPRKQFQERGWLYLRGTQQCVWRAGQCLRQGQILCQRAAFWRNMTHFLWWAPPGLSPLAAQPLCQCEVQWLSCCINKEVDSQLLIISFATVIQCIE